MHPFLERKIGSLIKRFLMKLFAKVSVGKKGLDGGKRN
jgi:hypothetical protein